MNLLILIAIVSYYSFKVKYEVHLQRQVASKMLLLSAVDLSFCPGMSGPRLPWHRTGS